MRLVLLFSFLCIHLSIFAQEDTALAARILTKKSYIRNKIAGWTNNPATVVYNNVLTDIRLGYANSRSRHYMKEQGNKEQHMGLQIKSFQKIDTNTAVWGNVSYKNGKTYNITGNETADVKEVYPYLMADTVGGDLKWQEYLFAGGYHRNGKNWTLGVDLNYRAMLAYRNVDPRPKNTISQLGAEIGVSRKIRQQYAMAVTAGISHYNQENLLSFQSPTGKPVVYHTSGMGLYNYLFSGSKLQAYYKGNKLYTGYNIYPLQKYGWFHAMRIAGNRLKKTILDLQPVPLSDLLSDEFNTQIGYVNTIGKNQFLGGQITVNRTHKLGKEYRYDNRGSSNFELISKENSYNFQHNRYSLEVFTGREITRNYGWELKAGAFREELSVRYLIPARLMRINSYAGYADVSTQFRKGKNIIEAALGYSYISKKNNQLNGEYTAAYFDELTLHNYRYFANSFQQFTVRAEWNIQYAGMALYTRFDGSLILFSDNKKNSMLQGSIGINF